MSRTVSTGAGGPPSMRPLAGCRVVVTRERPGTLAELLRERGADVVHVPLIEVGDPEDGGAALSAAFDDPSQVDWVLVTSIAGAERVTGVLGPEAVALVRFGAVGSATAEHLERFTGRPPDLVPDRQLGQALATAFAEVAHPRPQRVVVAQADRAAGDLVAGVRAAGHHVEAVVAYSTRLRTPTSAERHDLATADAVLFASGSAARSWTQALGADAPAPSIVVAIGPSTAAVARDIGLKVSAVAADHSVPGIVAELESVWRSNQPSSDSPDPVA